MNLPVWLFADCVTVVPDVCKEGVGVSGVIGVWLVDVTAMKQNIIIKL